jgi:soluble cytochrome b562
MRERFLISACIVLLMGGTAYAVDEEQACVTELADTETLVDQRVEAKALSEGEVEEVNMLLDEADALCTEGKYKKAKETLANVTKLVTPQAQ